ncbi:NAD(P)-dependent alcohol dehydrogenase [uncultured Nocardioides sp.]|uniref:NAD(P)-dependent alcohol dehydrogenase n=1 Tax=uncultured Nocardioides sp. TaxID=198441 RepID=UPI00261213BE|nr:NAD(P)-dependent alcohol dehydrogenase [uncultured Nocardioides sp.]
MRPTTALLADRPGAPLTPTPIERRDLRDDDVAVRVTHCGVCFTDLHHLRSTADGVFPLVPGHEFVGEVAAVGPAVTSYAVGDPVAVGNIVDSCGECRRCAEGQENWCPEYVLTYAGRDRHDSSRTLGGYSGEYVVRERFVHARPPGLDPAGVAPLLCAGITVWEPLRTTGVGPGSRVGVVGIGGLGHLAVRLAAALGAEVTAFTTSAAKADDARRLGATRVVVSTDAEQMAAAADSLDVVIDTVAVEHDLAPYLACVDTDGVLFPVGYLGPLTVDSMSLLAGRKRLSSSGSGGVDRTAELLAFCGEHGITADVEVLPAAEVATALDRLARNDVRFRFVLDTTAL